MLVSVTTERLRGLIETTEGELPPLALRELLLAMQQVLSRAALYTHHRIAREPLSVRARMSQILQRVQAGPPLPKAEEDFLRQP